VIRVLAFLALFLTNLLANILDVASLNNTKSIDYIYFINDKESLYTYKDIASKNDLQKLGLAHIGGAKGPFWTKISLTNSSSKIKNITLYNPLAGINKIDAYLLKNGELAGTLLLGDLRAQNLRDSLSSYSHLNLTIEPNESITIISKIENFHIYNLSWEILPTDDYFKKDSNKLYLAGLLGGVLLLFCIYNLINSVVYKNKIYLIICGIAISLGLYQYAFHGILYFLDLGLNLDLITAFAWSLPSFSAIFLLSFAYFFFEQHKKYKKASYITIFFMLCFVLLIALVLYAQFVDEKFFDYSFLIAIMAIATTLYLFLLSIYMLYKKEAGAIYYFIGEGTLFVVLFFHTLGLFNIISYSGTIQFLIPFAYIVDLLSLVIALYLKNQKEQQELRKSKLLLMEQSRFNSIGQAIGHISHQWKAPLTNIGTSLTLLETIYNHEQERLEETFAKQLPFMKRSIDLMKRSIDEFSAFYQTKNAKESFSIKENISNIVQILNAKILLKGVKIEYDIDENLEILSYEHIISNIFLILINNSLEAFKANSNNTIKISVKRSNNKISIVLEDNAGGIAIKPIERVFDYFVSLKSAEKSSGIGLAVAKLLVAEKLGGNISVKNGTEGAIFTIVIP